MAEWSIFKCEINYLSACDNSHSQTRPSVHYKRIVSYAHLQIHNYFSVMCISKTIILWDCSYSTIPKIQFLHQPAIQEFILDNVSKQQGCACCRFCVGERAEQLLGETWAAVSWHFDGLLGISFLIDFTSHCLVLHLRCLVSQFHWLLLIALLVCLHTLGDLVGQMF